MRIENIVVYVSQVSYHGIQITNDICNSNIKDLKELGCKNPLKLGDFGFDGADVPDPYFFDGLEGFDKVFEMIDVCVKNLIDTKI